MPLRFVLDEHLRGSAWSAVRRSPSQCQRGSASDRRASFEKRVAQRPLAPLAPSGRGAGGGLMKLLSRAVVFGCAAVGEVHGAAAAGECSPEFLFLPLLHRCHAHASQALTQLFRCQIPQQPSKGSQ